MRKINIKSISLLLAAVMILAALATSCSNLGIGGGTTAGSSSQETEEVKESVVTSADKPEDDTTEGDETTEKGNDSTVEDGSDSADTTESGDDGTTDGTTNGTTDATTETTDAKTETTDATTETTTETTVTTTESTETEPAETTEALIKGEYASSILEADKLSGGVKSYFSSSLRDTLVVENNIVNVNLGLTVNNDGYMDVFNKAGQAFLTDAFVPYVKSNGKYFYGNDSIGGSDSNIYRLGYYMYDVHVYGGDFFAGDGMVTKEQRIPLNRINKVKGVEKLESEATVYKYMVTDASDPRIYMTSITLNTNDYGFIKFSMKTEKCTGGQIYIITDVMADQDSFSDAMCVSFDTISDGEYHEYVVKLSDLPNYRGNIKKIRIDVGSAVGEIVEIKDITAFNIDAELPVSRYDRGLYVYSDKINQVLHLITPGEVDAVTEYGYELKIPADRVANFILEDANGIHTDLNRIHWNSVSYVGFDIKDVGVFGFIMINDELKGRVKVTFDGEYYTLYHYQYTDDGVLKADTDTYLGHRLYFGNTHSFDELQFEAWCERNPLTSENITVIDQGSSPMGRFYSYDGLRGAYKFDVRYGNWNNIFLNAQNMHYNVNAVIKGDGYDRKIYVYTSAVADGQTLECAVIMDKNGVLIPIPLEVCKNFAGDGEANAFLKDIGYSEVYFPLVIGADDELDITIAHLYQNWGKFPLKQIDSIQFYTPFYHLSCGVTETNCLRPYYDMNLPKNTKTVYCLPDHRAMSAPLWIDSKGSRDPQHTNGGFHNLLEYFGADGYVTTEFLDDTIHSYGPTYAEITMDYITDDGKIKVSYTHLEMPQTDENRGYYVCTYEFLEDLTITDSKKNFSFYSVAGRYVDYGKIGYLDENNDPAVVDNTLKGEAYYLLGDECPYFDLFKWMPTSADPNTENDYVNVSCLVYNYSVQMGGEEFDKGLGLYVQDGWAHLTLNADELNFKKGDKIAMNLIFIPWGSQISDYEREDPDWNIREVRKNTLLDPVTVTAANGEVVESVYLPIVRSTDGKSVEFTLSGGENNISFEVRDMKSIARPVVYELIDGEWVVYNYTSSETPDNRGNAHDYDGYMIRYDGEDNFAYSFVFDMSGDVERTFKIVVE